MHSHHMSLYTYVRTCIPCTQYNPLVTGAVQVVGGCCLILLQELALRDLAVPMDDIILYTKYYLI